IGVKNAKFYVEIAKKHLKSIRTRERIQSIIKTNKFPEVSRAEPKACDLNLFGTNRNKVSLDSIKKLALLDAEDISKLKGIEISNAKRYIDIANKYLESMRIKERGEDIVEILPLKQKKEIKTSDLAIASKLKKVSVLPKLKFKEYPKKPTAKTQTPKRIGTYQKRQNIGVKSTKRASYGIDIKTGRKKKKTSSPSILRTFFPLETMQKIRFLHHKIKNLEAVLSRDKEFSFSELNYILDYVKILNVNYKTQSQIKILKELDIPNIFYDPLAKK
ncbi:unnamed protein product, partial [marine sediment metagenome]